MHISKLGINSKAQPWLRLALYAFLDLYSGFEVLISAILSAIGDGLYVVAMARAKPTEDT